MSDNMAMLDLADQMGYFDAQGREANLRREIEELQTRVGVLSATVASRDNRVADLQWDVGRLEEINQQLEDTLDTTQLRLARLRHG